MSSSAEAAARRWRRLAAARRGACLALLLLDNHLQGLDPRLQGLILPLQLTVHFKGCLLLPLWVGGGVLALADVAERLGPC